MTLLVVIALAVFIAIIIAISTSVIALLVMRLRRSASALPLEHEYCDLGTRTAPEYATPVYHQNGHTTTEEYEDVMDVASPDQVTNI